MFSGRTDAAGPIQVWLRGILYNMLDLLHGFAALAPDLGWCVVREKSLSICPNKCLSYSEVVNQGTKELNSCLGV